MAIGYAARLAAGQMAMGYAAKLSWATHASISLLRNRVNNLPAQLACRQLAPMAPSQPPRAVDWPQWHRHGHPEQFVLMKLSV